MSCFDKIYSICTENHGIVTAAAARKLGIHRKDMTRWVKSGRMMRVGHGVYRVTQYPCTSEDAYAIAVANLGAKAYLCGESVIALLQLAPTNPRYIHVAVYGRCRRKIDPGCKVEIRHEAYQPMNYEGIPMERPVDAIRECIGRMMPDRLVDATVEAYRRGLVSDEDKERLLMEIRNVG